MLIMAEFQMEPSARFPELDATDLLKMRENNQNKNTERSTKNWVKLFDLGHAERSLSQIFAMFIYFWMLYN